MLTGDEPDSAACIPADMPEEYHWFEVAPPCAPHSPEHMAQWMIGRLSSRLAGFVATGNVHEVKQYVSTWRASRSWFQSSMSVGAIEAKGEMLFT